MLFNFVLLSALFAVLGFLGFMLHKELSEENLLSEKSNITIDRLSWSQKCEFKDLNTPFKCTCGITSRKYQFTGENHSICPQCDKKLDMGYTRWGDYLNEVTDTKNFPFAPELSVSEFLVLWNQKEEMKRIEKELKELEEYDKEIEAWENIQLNKIKQYEEKANQIKKDLEKQYGVKSSI